MKKNFRLHSIFLRNLNDEQKEHLEDSFKAATGFLNAFSETLEAKLLQFVQESENTSLYLEPNWELKQSHLLGYRAALRDVLNYFVDNKNRNNDD